MNSLGSGIMPILVKDFGEEIAAQLAEELDFYRGRCYYDEGKRKIVYCSLSDAFDVYMEIQRKEIIKRAENEGRNLNDIANIEWIREQAELFRDNWKKAHAQKFDEILEYLVCETSVEDF